MVSDSCPFYLRDMKEKEINAGYIKIMAKFKASIATMGLTKEQEEKMVSALEAKLTDSLVKKLKGDKKGIIKNRSQIRKEAQEEKRKEKKENKVRKKDIDAQKEYAKSQKELSDYFAKVNGSPKNLFIKP